MEWMDRARRFGGLLWVGLGLVFEIAWYVAGWGTPGPVTLVLMLAVTLLALAVVLRPGARAAWLAGWVTAVLLGLDLAGAVADRFGALGAKGAPEVSWGSWPAFVDDAAVLLHHPPRPVATTAALLATVVEVGLAVLLLAGWQRRWVGKGLAGLFVVYLVAMATSVGLAEVARYGMPVLVGGALLVSAVESRRPRVSGRTTEHYGAHWPRSIT